MINRKHIPIALLSILLLIGQLSVLIHAVEHPFHDHDESCDIFISSEQSSDNLLINSLELPIVNNHSLVINTTTALFTTLELVYHARAPPFFLS